MIQNMSGRRSATVLAIAAAMAIVGSRASWAFFDGGRHRGGYVLPCSLDGVNPVYHPGIFRNPAVAAAYGFFQSPSGRWQVRPDCMRGVNAY
jgi:hypothetical protein